MRDALLAIRARMRALPTTDKCVACGASCRADVQVLSRVRRAARARQRRRSRSRRCRPRSTRCCRCRSPAAQHELAMLLAHMRAAAGQRRRPARRSARKAPVAARCCATRYDDADRRRPRDLPGRPRPERARGAVLSDPLAARGGAPAAAGVERARPARRGARASGSTSATSPASRSCSAIRRRCSSSSRRCAAARWCGRRCARSSAPPRTSPVDDRLRGRRSVRSSEPRDPAPRDRGERARAAADRDDGDARRSASSGRPRSQRLEIGALDADGPRRHRQRTSRRRGVRGLPPVQQLFETTRAYPGHVEHVVRYLLEGGKAEDTKVSLPDLIAARLSMLAQSTRDVLQAAAVLGIEPQLRSAALDDAERAARARARRCRDPRPARARPVGRARRSRAGSCARSSTTRRRPTCAARSTRRAAAAVEAMSHDIGLLGHHHDLAGHARDAIELLRARRRSRRRAARRCRRRRVLLPRARRGPPGRAVGRHRGRRRSAVRLALGQARRRPAHARRDRARPRHPRRGARLVERAAARRDDRSRERRDRAVGRRCRGRDHGAAPRRRPRDRLGRHEPRVRAVSRSLEALLRARRRRHREPRARRVHRPRDARRRLHRDRRSRRRSGACCARRRRWSTLREIRTARCASRRPRCSTRNACARDSVPRASSSCSRTLCDKAGLGNKAERYRQAAINEMRSLGDRRATAELLLTDTPSRRRGRVRDASRTRWR